MITDYEVFKAVRSFLVGLFPDVEVVRAQVNDVPMPKGAFIAMNDVSRHRIATNIRTYNDTGDDQGTQNTVMKTDHIIQLDFYGPNSAQQAHTFATLFLDYYAYDNFPEDVKPLYCTDPVQAPLISGEENYVERWRCEVHVQINPVVVTPMQFFDSVDITVNPPANTIQDQENG